FFFFQAEDGIRDFHVTGVQTCASSDLSGGLGFALALDLLCLGIGLGQELLAFAIGLCTDALAVGHTCSTQAVGFLLALGFHASRSEERRVGKGGRARGWPGQEK